MTKSGFDLDEIERRVSRASPNDRAYERPMNWDEAATLLTEIRELRAENARLKRGLTNINRKASPDPERTMSEASNDLYWCACEARAALGEPQ